MQRDDTLTELWGFVPPALWHRTVIAGGYAADPTKAEDVDLWVYGFTNLDEAAERIHDHLNAGGVKWDLPEVKQYDGAEAELDNEDVAVIAELYSTKAGLKVQLIISKHPTPQDILETFDLSVHMWAFGRYGEGYIGISRSTKECEPIRVTRLTTPRRTLERYYRLCMRYGQEPRQEEWSKLQKALEDKHPGPPPIAVNIIAALLETDDVPF